MEAFNPFLIGVTLVLAGAAIGVMYILRGPARAQFVYAQLCVMAGVYVGFAVVGIGDKEFIARSDWSALLVESVIALVFLFAGLAALGSHRQWLLGGLIFAHGATDLLHLTIDGSAGPAWYAFGCVLYDAVVGAAAVILLSAPNAQSR